MRELFPADVSDIRNHIQRLEAAGQSARTTQARERVICRLARELGVPLKTATRELIVSWLARPKWARATRSIYRYHIGAYYLDLTKTGRIRRNPAGDLPLVRVPKRIPRPVADKALAQILRRSRPPYRRYFVIAAYAGLRCAEIALLHTDDVTPDMITVYGKGDKVRLVDTHDLVWAEVSTLPRGPIWHLPHPDPVEQAHKVSERCSMHLTRLGFPDVTMHRLRATFATRLLRPVRFGGSGAHILMVKELLGHESVAATERYCLVGGEERRLAVRALPAVA
jgi:integrase